MVNPEELRALAPVTWREIVKVACDAVYDASKRWPHSVPEEVSSATAGLVRKALIDLHARHLRTRAHTETQGGE